MSRLLLIIALLLPLSALAEVLNDPMRPSHAPRTKNSSPTGVSAPSYRLDSIIIASDRRLAMINGRHLGEGDRIGRATVTRIEATRVILRTGTHSQVLTLLPVSIKSPSNEANP